MTIPWPVASMIRSRSRNTSWYRFRSGQLPGFPAYANSTAKRPGNHHAFTIAACTWKSNGFSPATWNSQ
jgi:hypothetical protein